LGEKACEHISSGVKCMGEKTVKNLERNWYQKETEPFEKRERQEDQIKSRGG